ncbi:class II aldolase/adducin family protein [Nitrospirillum sp. BR 11164]|uniref:class II aldolase/adducin family protein n=1 Tax=Nitrospirillum sp. BR 11164 TaxID=3104324 RepID=UPI002AFF9612|nr:class II aldolase/adducin family protein [Nitrospirillum sp. BR 11164]MEA1651695.1 class II aldolase/adducin family protein [Nitrospirillum sp. BR 11164]
MFETAPTLAPADQPPLRDRVSAEEWRLRVDLAAAYRLVALFGWDDLVFTHISARVPGPEHHFLINPYGMLFEEITASSLVKVDMDGKVVLDTGFPVNPAGFTIHSAVHQVREDAGCVLHLHTADGTAVSTLEEGLLPLNQTAQLVIDDLAYHDYEGVAFEHDERPRLQRDLGAKNTMLLRNHGTLTVGRTVAEAFTRMYFLERSCTMQVRTLTMGRPLYPAPHEAIERNIQISRMGVSQAANLLVWPALLRRLARQMPGYAD